VLVPRIIVLACFLLLGCERRETYSPDSLGDMESKVRLVLSAEQNFRDAHPNKGVAARKFIDDLRSEGFTCRAQYRRSMRFEPTGSATSFVVPTVVCIGAPANLDPCVEFRVGLDFKKEAPDLPPLVAKLDSLVADDAVFICETRTVSAENQDEVRKGISQGYVLPISD
jgi:hypothetical protein